MNNFSINDVFRKANKKLMKTILKARAKIRAIESTS